jgi:hypothetical protein
VDGRLSQASADQFLACFGLRERSRGTFRTSKFSMEEHRPKNKRAIGFTTRLFASNCSAQIFQDAGNCVCYYKGCIGAVPDQQLERDGTSNLAAV